MSKLTSLSAQLKRLQVPQTSVLLSSAADKRRVSFLYEPNEAANMDSEAVYCLAINGLEQLKAIDRTTFESFESTLFNPTSITFERAVQTKQVNDKLNEEIRRFLLHLSPYFMLKPAHKCLEWLVYRYQIHNYNLNELFMCIMPYHETNYFVRALQMLSLETTTNENKLWQWLEENQKKGVVLSPVTLATHLYSDLSFFNFMITDYLNHVLDLWWYSVGQISDNDDDLILPDDLQQKHFLNNLNFVFSFLAKLLLESVKQLDLETNLSVKSRKSVNNKQQEAFLAQLLPILFTGFKSELILYKQTAYLVGAFLFERFKFTSETTSKALFAISKGMSLFRLDASSDKMDIDDNENTELEDNSSSEQAYTDEQVDCIKSALLTVCVMIQCQYDEKTESEENGEHFKASSLLNRNFIKKFIKNFRTEKQIDLVYSIIDNMNQAYKVDKFLKCLLGRMLAESVHSDHAHSEQSLSGVNLDLDQNDDELELVKNDKNVYFRLANKLLTLLNFSHTPSLVDHFTTSLLDVLGKQIDGNNNNNVPNLYVEFHLCSLIHKLEDKYPARFDSCLSQILASERLSQKQRSYLLTVISCKFNSSRCKSAFKYQQVKSSEVAELNLFMAVNHANQEIRANAFAYILNELKDKSGRKTIDTEFVKDQLKQKLEHESSPLVLKSILSFNDRLFDYFEASELIGNRSLLLRIFTSTRIESLLNDNNDDKKHADVSEHYQAENNKWFECREMVLHILFDGKHNKSSDSRDMLFNIFVRIAASLFELKEISLIRKLKSTQFYENIQAESNAESNTSSKKGSFYSKSSVTISKMSDKLSQNGNAKHDKNTSENDDEEEESEELDEMFEQFLQDSAKYLLSESNKTKDNLIKIPSYFESLGKTLNERKTHRDLELIDLVVYELSVRLSAQSLFLTNSAYFLNLALQILYNLFASSFTHHSVFNLKFKAKSNHKSNTDSDSNQPAVNKKLNTVSGFLKMCLKQTVSSKSLPVVSQLYTNLFKSLAIQQSNFVPANTKIEIELLVATIYKSLCHIVERAQTGAWFFESVLNKFIQTNFSHSVGGPQYVSPSKSSSNMQSFYYFSFRFLAYFGDDESLLDTRVKTIKLYAQRTSDLVESSVKSGDLLNALVLLISWCLTSKQDNLRLAALRLLENMQTVVSEKVATDDKEKGWIGPYLKKLLKHRQEIEIDGTDYVRSKSLNKILDIKGNSEAIYRVLNHFISLAKAKNGKLAQHYYIGSDFILTGVKYALLDLFSRIRDEHKLHLLDSLFNLVFSILNDSPNLLQLDESERELEIKEKEKLISLIVSDFVLSEQSSSFLNKHEKHFDFLIGYLNNHIDNEANFLIKHFRETFMTRLADTNRSVQFFQNLSQARLQPELLKACFDNLYKSRNLIKQTDGGRYDILISFGLTSAHLVCLFNERAKLHVNEQKQPAGHEISTTKQIKKQMLSGGAESVNNQKAEVDWSSVKMILELVQSILIRDDSKMETDEEVTQSANETFIDLIPYLFLVLERIEQRLSQDDAVELTINEEDEENENSLLNQIKSLLYLETISLNVLLLVYKFNKQVNRAKLDQSKFNIELLMQMLQSKEFAVESSIQIDRLNVQQHILILLSQIASIFPDKVLEHVIIMFIFVGNKLARKDDSYSFQIISQVIKSILPSIVDSVQQHQSENGSSQPCDSRLISTIDVMQRHQKQLPYVSSLVCKILQSFVVSLPHMPAHRKTMIFAQLMQIIGLNDYLWITVIQSIDYYLVQSTDLLSFTNNLEQMTNRQQQILAKSEDVVSKSEKKLRDAIKTNLQAMISLFVQFEPIQLIKSSVYLVTFMNKYISNLFENANKIGAGGKPRATDRKSVYSHLACQLDNYNLLQMKYLGYNMLQFVNDLLTSEDLFTKLAAFYEESKTSAAAEAQKKVYTNLFQSLLEKILQLVLKLTQLVAQIGSDDDDLKKFHKAILNKTYELMEKTINLLDTRQFIDVIKYLINPETTENLIQIRRRALGLLNNKLRKYEPDESERTLLMTMLDDLLRSIQLQDSYLADAEINNQTVLFSIKLICKRIGEHTPLAFVKVLAYLSEKLIDKKLYFNEDEKKGSRLRNVNLLSSVLLCIGEVCLKLKTNSLKHLGQIMVFNLDVIDFIRKKLGDIDLEKAVGYELVEEFNSKESKVDLSNEYKNYELLILSTVTCLLKIVQNMSQFLSPYLHRLVYVTTSLSNLTHNFSNTSDNQQQIDTRLGQLRSMIATLIPLRLLAPILNEQSVAFTDSNTPLLEYKMRVKNVEYYMHIARMAIKSASQEDLLANIRILKAMFMNLFNMRSGVFKANKKLVTVSSGKKLDAFMTKEISKYEDYVVGGFSELTLKLSEDLFRPMFFSLYEWASTESDDSAGKERLITFYRATFKLSDKLKSLFVLFASQFVQNAADLLNSLNSIKTSEKFFASSSTLDKEQTLLVSVIDTLSNVFLNDAQRVFVNKERFSLFMEPLVDQLENEQQDQQGESGKSYTQFVTQHLGPCIANLGACCANDDVLCRKLNYHLLLKTKSSSVQVRLATLDVLNLFTKKVGDLYNSYVGETIPFLAELMEDPVEEVEDKVQLVITELEELLGENLQSQFI